MKFRQRRTEGGDNVDERICAALDRIAECLERIEKALPECDQGALKKEVVEAVTHALQTAASSAHTRELYK